MEYLLNDFYLKFGIICNKEGNCIDYILEYVSDEFEGITDIDPSTVLGRKLSDLLIDYGNRLSLKEIYFRIITNMKLKFDIFIDDLQRLYLVSVFRDRSCGKKQMIVFFSDITQVKESDIKPAKIDKSQNNIIYFTDDMRASMYYRDRLTGLYNKNFFEEEVRRLDTIRQLPMSIIMGDINGFKLINDIFGYDMGDILLEKVAEAISESFREEDILSRIGADEFMVLLPGTSEEDALKIANRVKVNCESGFSDYLKISISFGVATKDDPTVSIEEIIREAEEKMYSNKLMESKKAQASMINSIKNMFQK